MATFIRMLSHDKNREILANINHISTIEVKYLTKSGDKFFEVATEKGIADPEHVRVYLFTVGGETFAVRSDDPAPLSSIFGELYKKAIGFDQPPTTD